MPSHPCDRGGITIHLEDRRELDRRVERQRAGPHGKAGVFPDGLAEDLAEEIRGPVDDRRMTLGTALTKPCT
jgi:hypothetical protein